MFSLDEYQKLSDNRVIADAVSDTVGRAMYYDSYHEWLFW